MMEGKKKEKNQMENQEKIFTNLKIKNQKSKIKNQKSKIKNQKTKNNKQK